MQRVHYDLVDSTSTEARRLAAAYPGERLVVTAARQSAGRGRHGRTWHSPLGGAWMSVVWPARHQPRFYAPTSLVAAVAVRRALKDVAGEHVRIRIKWPNDLLIADRKVAGILCEQCPAEGGAGSGVIIVGIGVNVDFDPALLSDDLRHPATTLSQALGWSPDVDVVISAVTHHFVDAMEIFERVGLSEALLADLRSNLAYAGTVRTWSSPRGLVTGRVLGIDPAGRLLLQCGDKQIACEVGEFVIEPAGSAVIEPPA